MAFESAFFGRKSKGPGPGIIESGLEAGARGRWRRLAGGNFSTTCPTVTVTARLARPDGLGPLHCPL
eukprot:3493616-Rhodomonas_salina.1